MKIKLILKKQANYLNKFMMYIKLSRNRNNLIIHFKINLLQLKIKVIKILKLNNNSNPLFRNILNIKNYILTASLKLSIIQL